MPAKIDGSNIPPVQRIWISPAKRSSKPLRLTSVAAPRMDRDITGVMLTFACKPVRYQVFAAERAAGRPQTI